MADWDADQSPQQDEPAHPVSHMVPKTTSWWQSCEHSAGGNYNTRSPPHNAEMGNYSTVRPPRTPMWADTVLLAPPIAPMWVIKLL